MKDEPINPVTIPYGYEYVSHETHLDKIHIGLTKREYFAGLAMQGMLTTVTNRDEIHKFTANVISNSITMADALLKELDDQT